MSEDRCRMTDARRRLAPEIERPHRVSSRGVIELVAASSGFRPSVF